MKKLSLAYWIAAIGTIAAFTVSVLTCFFPNPITVIVLNLLLAVLQLGLSYWGEIAGKHEADTFFIDAEFVPPPDETSSQIDSNPTELSIAKSVEKKEAED